MKTDKCLINYKSIADYSKQFDIPQIDVLMIALNRYGVRASMNDKRLRFKFLPSIYDEVFYMALCINTYASPFSIVGDEIQIDGISVGKIFDIEKDTCDATYFRRNKTELTLNSNMRSLCKGCTFCGTYNLDPDDRIDMSDDQKIADFIQGYLKQNNVKDLSNLLRVTVCTGCFHDEKRLVDHLISVYRVFSQFGFDKRIRYIGSQIRSEEAMDTIQKAIPYFSLSLTVECFSDRQKRMREEKASLDTNAISEILARAKAHGFSANYLYIVGLDPISVMCDGVKELLPNINRMPVFQVMQNYVESHEAQRTSEAEDFAYYLKARKSIEEIFKDTELHPRTWENYRSLFYSTYQNKPYQCIRI